MIIDEAGMYFDDWFTVNSEVSVAMQSVHDEDDKTKNISSLKRDIDGREIGIKNNSMYLLRNLNAE